MFVREALAQGGADLKFAGIKTPGLDASLLLSHILKKSRTELLAHSDELLSEEVCEEYCSLIERRCYGECAAYLTGKKEFRELEFIVNSSVLVPRPDTETLVDAALQAIDLHITDYAGTNNELLAPSPLNIKILDLCTGSGAVAVALKHERPFIEVHASDISSEALEIAEQNADRLLGENKILFFPGDLFDALPSSDSAQPYSLIISNPPYIPSDEIQSLSLEVQNEPRIALDGGKSGLDIIKRIINKAPDYMQNNGVLLLEADPRQMEEIKSLMENRGFKKIKIYCDLSSSQRVIGGHYEK